MRSKVSYSKEEPTNPDLIIDTNTETLEESSNRVIRLLSTENYLPGFKNIVSAN